MASIGDGKTEKKPNNCRIAQERPAWHVKISLTQAPHPYQQDVLMRDLEEEWQEPELWRTFLYDPVGRTPPATYGIRLSASQNLEVEFYANATSEEEAKKIGLSWLSSLRYKFLGLDGTIEVVPLASTLSSHDEGGPLFELRLPRFLTRKKVNLVEKFVNLFYHESNTPVQMFLAWQRMENDFKTSDDEGDRLLSNYHLRVFFTHEGQEEQDSRIVGLLSFMALDLETHDGILSRIHEASDLKIKDVLSLNLFNGVEKNKHAILTCREMTFDFPVDLPLPRFPIVEGENVRYIDLSAEFVKQAVSLGKHLKDSVITDHEVFTPIKKLSQDVAIFGKSGSGKTFFLARFVKELAQKVPEVGILVLNLAKSSQEAFYDGFKVIRYTDDDFSLPYYYSTPEAPREKLLQETATHICASLGLKNVFEKIIYRTQVGFERKVGKLPEHFIHLLTGVENYIKNNPYGPEEQANLLQVFRNRKNVFDEEKIMDVLRIRNGLPDWLEGWLGGMNVFLDLSACNKFVKTLLVNCLFQVVRTVTKDEIEERLKHLIVIDEAHSILEKPITTNSDDADFIVKEQMNKIFSELLKEYRSRGVGFVLADQSPSSLFGDVVAQPSLKVIFRQDYPNNLMFSESPTERQALTQLPNRIALVLNGATGEKFLVKTLDFNGLSYLYD